MPENEPASTPPDDYKVIYQGQPLPPFYLAEMLRPYIGKTIWAVDDAGRTRCGMLKDVPRLREDAAPDSAPPVTFEDEKPLFLRKIVCMAHYSPNKYGR
jgi:hypothetical protein